MFGRPCLSSKTAAVRMRTLSVETQYITQLNIITCSNNRLQSLPTRSPGLSENSCLDVRAVEVSRNYGVIRPYQCHM